MNSDGIKQVGKILSEIVSNLKDYPVFLFGIASMLIAIISIWVIAFASVPIPEFLAWFPYALLIFGIVIIILAPTNSAHRFNGLDNVTESDEALDISVSTKWLTTRLGRVNVVLCGLNLLWGVYLGNKVGSGLDSLWNSIYSWFNETAILQINQGWIIGSSINGFLVGLVVIYATIMMSLDAKKPLFSTGVLLAGIAVATLAIPILSVFYSPVSAFVWWLSSGNILITVVAAFSVPVLLIGGVYIQGL